MLEMLQYRLQNIPKITTPSTYCNCISRWNWISERQQPRLQTTPHIATQARMTLNFQRSAN